MLTLLRFFIYLFFNEYLSRMEHLILGDPGAVSVRESPWRHCPTRAPSLEIDSQPLGLRPRMGIPRQGSVPRIWSIASEWTQKGGKGEEIMRQTNILPKENALPNFLFRFLFLLLFSQDFCLRFIVREANYNNIIMSKNFESVPQKLMVEIIRRRQVPLVRRIALVLFPYVNMLSFN